MIKYAEVLVTFAEVPDEITLCFNITNCKIHCPKCHSKWLWDDVGTPLTISELNKEIEKNKGITCVAFMGGTIEILPLLKRCKELNLKTCWYSGDKYNEKLLEYLDYYKYGPFIEYPLNNKLTNQVFLSKNNGHWNDITYKFWKK